jgi:hypothetical protein
MEIAPGMKTWYVHFKNDVGYMSTYKVEAGTLSMALIRALQEYKAMNSYGGETADRHVTEVGLWQPAVDWGKTPK